MSQSIRSAEDIVELVREFGFLPFFRHEVPGLSVEEFCPAELWFAADTDGPWEWKGPAASSGKCMYGKLFRGKAGFVSREWLPDLVNLRRGGLDFDERCGEGLVYYKDCEVFRTVSERGPLLSKTLKALCNYRKGGSKGFDTVITRLQMQTYVCISDFVYMRDAFGRPYGWGVAEYAAPESLFGGEFVSSAYGRSPDESLERMLAHLAKKLPNADEAVLKRLLVG